MINAAQDLLHSITPDRFYTEFNSINPDLNPDLGGKTKRVPVEQQLRQKIEKALTQRFHLTGLQITPKMADTKLTKRFTELCRGLHELDIPVDF